MKIEHVISVVSHLQEWYDQDISVFVVNQELVLTAYKKRFENFQSIQRTYKNLGKGGWEIGEQSSFHYVQHIGISGNFRYDLRSCT